ncbi:MAG: hypothetical protein CMC83_07440 [Flavobacteriaceae bacterium]|nr:hypothetical protein [Flavobacteriaceae bacterium]|tara:strand:- start:192 stop:767 length:576 start_codon:yes stop_codon:yes gene_type:complete
MSIKETIRDNWPLVEERIRTLFNKYRTEFKKDEIEFSTKQQSELMSEIAQSSFLNVLKEKNINAEVKVGVNVADIYIDGIPVEIKTCGAEKWQGGSFSKRPGLYLLLSWKYLESTKLFCAMQDMVESDWRSHMLNEDNKMKKNATYYGTWYGKRELVEDNRYELLSGWIDIIVEKKDGSPRKVPNIHLKWV